MSSVVVEEATERAAALRSTLASRVVISDGAMGTMIQASDATLDDFEGHEGCNEVLNATRPDIIVDIHRAYLATGADCVTTNTFGTNLANLGEYGITERITELAEAGARLARQATDEFKMLGMDQLFFQPPLFGDVDEQARGADDFAAAEVRLEKRQHRFPRSVLGAEACLDAC